MNAAPAPAPPQHIRAAQRKRHLKATALGAAMLAGLAGTSLGSSVGSSVATPATATSAPQNFPEGHPCPVTGDGKAGSDPSLDALKNRYLGPSLDQIVPLTTPAAMIALPQPMELEHINSRANWPNDAAVQQVYALETRAATIEGYLIDIRKENGNNGESANCHDPQTLFDYHIYVADQAAVPIGRAVVAEVTPRWRSVNPSWGTAENNYSGYTAIDSFKNQRVRVTGWLLFDEKHLNELGKSRATVWEIHPVTTFQYQKNGSWVTR